MNKNHFIQTAIVFVIIFLTSFKVNISYNEMDVIPYGRAFYNEDWLKNDWYLSLKTPYRFLFSYPIGFFYDNFGFLKTIYVGRIISYILIAISATKLVNTISFNKSFIYYLLALAVFFYYFSLGLGAGEWIVGGLDTKVFAYGFTLLSISYFIKNDIKKWLLFSGLTLSFHILIGFYNLLSFLPLILVLRKNDHTYVNQIIKYLPFFIISGSIGIYGIIDLLINTTNSISNIGWDIYVNIRVPHHTIPSLFSKKIWVFFILFSTTNIYILLKTNIERLKLLSIYALSTVGISLAGLSVFLFYGNSIILRYYFFRFSDVILPLLTIISISYFISEKIKATSDKIKNISYYSTIIAISVFLIFSIKQIYSEVKTISSVELYDLDMIAWVKNNTSTDDIFIVNPNSNMFYINYERPIFVSWKHSPQNNDDIIEWYNRLKLLNGGIDFTTQSEVKSNYKNLTRNQVLEIQQSYKNLIYILVAKPKTLNFPIKHKTLNNTLYEITN